MSSATMKAPMMAMAGPAGWMVVKAMAALTSGLTRVMAARAMVTSPRENLRHA